MAERVGHHQARRANHWVTLEAPLNIEQAVAQVPNGHAALLDCLTLWASQVMFNTQEDAAPVSETEAFARQRCGATWNSCKSCTAGWRPRPTKCWRWWPGSPSNGRRLVHHEKRPLRHAAGAAVSDAPADPRCLPLDTGLPVACPWTPATRRWAIRAYPLVGLNRPSRRWYCLACGWPFPVACTWMA